MAMQQATAMLMFNDTILRRDTLSANGTTTLNLYVHPNMEQKRRCITKMFKKYIMPQLSE